jgi:hypothetical protein
VNRVNSRFQRNNNLAIDPSDFRLKEKRVAQSQELRRKDNGNYISSIYPPEYALTRPKRVNDAIEQELVDFMNENEEKFRNSNMNQNYVFPRKLILTTTDSLRHKDVVGEHPPNLSAQSHRRYKSQENKYSSQFVFPDSGSTQPLQIKNMSILNKAINVHSIGKNLKFKIDQKFMRKVV